MTSRLQELDESIKKTIIENLSNGLECQSCHIIDGEDGIAVEQVTHLLSTWDRFSGERDEGQTVPLCEKCENNFDFEDFENSGDDEYRNDTDLA